MAGDAPFWVNSGQFGIAKVHRVECHHCRVGGQSQIKTRDGSYWSPFDDYASARAFAERVRGERWDHLDVDCRNCKPGSR